MRVVANRVIVTRRHPFWEQSVKILTEVSGMSPATLSRVRNGAPCSGETIAAILHGSKLSFDELFQVWDRGEAPLMPTGFKIPPGFRLVPVDPAAPEAATAPVGVPLPQSTPSLLPTDFDTAVMHPSFTLLKIKVDDSVRDDEEDPTMWSEAAVMQHTFPDGRILSIYGVERDGTIRTWQRFRETRWKDLIIESIAARFGLTYDEVDSYSDGVYTQTRAEGTISRRDEA